MSELPNNRHNQRKQERRQNLLDIITSTWKLALFGLAGSTLLVVTATLSKPKIAANEEKSLLGKLNQVISADRYNNDLYRDVIDVNDKRVTGNRDAVAVYRARQGRVPVAAVIAAVAPDGYSGEIELLVAVNANGKLSGVRVVKHRETPGLGDKIDIKRDDWIKQFKGMSLNKPAAKAWAVKKDGGQFDQFTGATITPRAVVKAVHNTLEYFQENRDSIFARQAENSKASGKANGNE